jgi:arsenite methyltransferase
MSTDNKSTCCEGNDESPQKGEENNPCNDKNIEESQKQEGDIHCCGGDTDNKNQEKLEGNSECGCGCGGEFPDISLVENPENPENAANAEFFEDFKKFATSMGIVSIGYTQISTELINKEEPLSNAIVLTFEMGKDIIKTPPGSEAHKLNDATYAKLGNITYALSDFIRANGFATQVAHPYGNMVGFSQLGQEAGLGWIGQSGLLITPELGPRIKISAILTSIKNLPLKKTDDHSWIPEYCEKCGKCIKACPEKALIETEACCGGKEIEFIQKRCIGCSQGCTYCIEDCPFDEKGYSHLKTKFDKMNAKLRKKKSGKIA